MAQTLSNSALSGKYYFRHLSLSTDTAENITDLRSLSGSITFDGAGAYSFAGEQTLGTAALTPFNGNGTYSVSPAGMVTMSNPQRPAQNINARFGIALAGEGMVIGAGTEALDNTFDLFVAVAAPLSAVSNATLRDSYFTVNLEFPAASSAALHSGFFQLQSNAQGGFSAISVHGHSVSASSGNPFTQSVTGATYSISSDGSGFAIFPTPAGSAALLNGSKTLYLSSRGSVILGGSRDPGVHDILIGVKALPAGATNASWTGKFWGAGLRFELGGVASAYAGSTNAIAPLNKITFSRRMHQMQPLTYDFTGVNDYGLVTDGSGVAELTQVAVGAAGSAFVGAAVDNDDPTAYEVFLGVRIPDVSGPGVFLNPQGVLNGGSFAPPGAPISPGEFITLYGTGLAPQSLATSAPTTAGLAGVRVFINNRLAPVSYVSGTQINALVPYGTVETTATIMIDNNGAMSNAVVVPVSATAPGVFSLSQNGVGEGAILHADFSVVNAGNPAHLGETVSIFLTGLGAVSPAVADGAPGGSNPSSATTMQADVIINGQLAVVSSSRLAPGIPGVYQIKATIPKTLTVTTPGIYPLAVRTPVSFHDQVDIALAP
jgi:uncharacterized protein (TIGR03437 family)